MNAILLQKKLFAGLKERYQQSKDFHQDLAQLLGLGQSAAYKRINGQILLNVDELMRVAAHFELSLDEWLYSSGPYTSFRFPALVQKPESLQSYLDQIEQDLTFLSQARLLSLDYVSNDLPIFHYLGSPKLLAFKLFIWGRTIWDWPDFQEQQFSIEKMIRRFPVLKEQKKLAELYDELPSTEYWKTSILDHILGQIRHYRLFDVFENPKDATVLCEELSFLLKKIKKSALRGYKNQQPHSDAENGRKNFQLYQNEITNTNNIILVEADQLRAVYTTFDSPNFMINTDTRQVQYTKNWFDRIQKRSRLISGSESNCLQFFKTLETKVRRAQVDLRSLLNA